MAIRLASRNGRNVNERTSGVDPDEYGERISVSGLHYGNGRNSEGE